MSKTNESWGSSLGLVLAMAGNAVGFGNFLRFPVQAISNGGGAFIIPYLVCFVIMGLPLMFIEWTIGRWGGQFGDHSTPFMMERMGKKPLWRYVGIFGIFSSIAVSAYYCYMESWTLSYMYHSVIGTFKGMSQGEVAAFFTDYHNMNSTHSGIPYENVGAFLLCLALNVWILSRGLQQGIEKVAKIGVPLLVVLGIFLAIKGLTIKSGVDGAVANGISGLNFLWKPQYDTLLDPKVWLAAAGQIFFTLSLGMGCVQCYASYLKRKDDIALSSLTTGFVNEFVEIVLGGTILISITVGFFGISTVQQIIAQEGGLGMAFQSMPFLFQKWGPFLGVIAGFSFFALLFLAGITSSLAMGSPLVSFLQDEFNFKKKHAALTLGMVILLAGLPCVLFYKQGVFDEFDYWAGTVGLFFFAMCEAVLFSWIFGVNKGWKEFTHAAKIKVPRFFKYLLLYITPTILIVIFLSALIKPTGDDWGSLSFKGWKLDNESIIGRMKGKSGVNDKWFADTLYSEIKDGFIQDIENYQGELYVVAQTTSTEGEYGYVKRYIAKNADEILVKKGDKIVEGTPIFKGKFINDSFYVALARMFLLLIFFSGCIMLTLAVRKRRKENRSVKY
jgi:SNF family Na+-dependent transporter